GASPPGMFGSREAIAKAKGEVVEPLPPDGTAVLNADDPQVAAMADRTMARVVLFGLGAAAEVRAEGVELDGEGRARFLLHTPDGTAPATLPAPGEHLVGCALAAAAAAHVLGVGPADGAPRGGGCRAPPAAGRAAPRLSPMRMQVRRRSDGLTVVNDAYNANPSSGEGALKHLAPPGERGPGADDARDRVGRLAPRLGIGRLVGVGEQGRVMVNAARMEGMWPEEAAAVADPEAALALLAPALGPADVVLVKASRVVALDRVADALLAPRNP